MMRRWTVDEYLRMAETGIIGPDERVELIDGEIVTVPPMGESHASSIMKCNQLFVVRFLDRAIVMPKIPFRMSPRSMPEPDFGLVRIAPDLYAHRRPEPDDTHLLVEISDSRLAFDRGPKLAVYARARVPEYWIVNLPDDRLEVYREPHDLGYREQIILPRDEAIAPLAFPNDRIAADDLLPAR